MNPVIYDHIEFLDGKILMIEMTLKLALIGMEAVQSKSEELHVPITVSVVDEAGGLVLTARADAANIFTPQTSRGKAMAAVVFRRPSKDLVDMARTNPAYWSALPSLCPGQVLPSTGAVPIELDGRTIGAIGCGGGSPDEDHECAMVGKEVIEASLS
jgi:uncharacterized protein GlcG (DUF336 family)